MASIASRVAVAGRQTTSTISTLGRWLHTNVAVVNDAQLRQLLAAHGDFGIITGFGSFILPLERYVSARIASMDRTTVAMCVDLLRRQRWLSTRILDAVACECSYLYLCILSRLTASLSHTLTPTHLHSNTPPLRHTSTPTHLHSGTPALQHTSTHSHLLSNTPPLRHTSTQAHLHSDTPPLQCISTPTHVHSDTPPL